jgi:hypothetical protein
MTTIAPTGDMLTAHFIIKLANLVSLGEDKFFAFSHYTEHLVFSAQKADAASLCTALVQLFSLVKFK